MSDPFGSAPDARDVSSGMPHGQMSVLARTARLSSLARMVHRTAVECGLSETTEVVTRALEAAAAASPRDGGSVLPVVGRNERRSAEAVPGSRIVIGGRHDRERVGTVVEARGSIGDFGYLVEWADGERSLLYPGSGTRILPPEAGPGPELGLTAEPGSVPDPGVAGAPEC